MTYWKITSLIFMMMLLSPGLFAQEPRFEPYFYLGAGVGISDYDDLLFCGECPNSRADFTNVDEKGMANFGFAGYRFHRNVAVEVTAYNLGSTDFTTADETLPIGSRPMTYIYASSRGVNAALKGILPVSKRFDLFAKVGWHYYDLDGHVSITDPPEVRFESRRFGWTSTDLSYAAGLDYRLGRSWSLGVAYETYVGDTSDYDHPSLEADDFENDYRFDLRNLQINFAYRF